MLILGIQHIAIHVSNLNKSLSFYQHFLNLVPMPRPDLGFEGAWLKVNQHQEIHLIAGLNHEVYGNRIGNHFAFQVNSIQESCKYLEEHNYPFLLPKQRPDGAWQIFLEDPDGYTIELYQP